MNQNSCCFQLIWNPNHPYKPIHPSCGIILGPFWDHFGRSWGPCASILAVLDPPGALPGGLLGRLGASWGASGPPNLNFDRFWISLERSWSHFGAILDAQDLILDVQTSILEPQVPHLGGSKHQFSNRNFPLPQSSMPASLQSSKSPSRGRRNARSVSINSSAHPSKK